LENGEREGIKKQVLACPSGALQWVEFIPPTLENQESTAIELDQKTLVELSVNGPLLVKGKFLLVHPDGSRELREKSTALCRCGASANKPFCDGTHRKIDFQG